ncbi:MAG: ferrous iron transport protein B [Anaerolineae bacterium]|nr:ferrous iron transport protein B [Anaerolineae bacterium]
MQSDRRIVRVAIAGNPNSGKTTLLNQLVGSRFAVGNWPGVTVERKEGVVDFQGWRIEIVDLPGIYTLEPIAEDEQIAADCLTRERPDVILNVIETPRLERALTLTVELAERGIPMVVALNMSDEAQRAGLAVDCEAFHALTGIRALPTNGRTGQGVRELLPAILEAHRQQQRPALRIARDMLSEVEPQSLADERLGIAEGLYRAVIRRREPQGRALTAAVDKVLLHPVGGLIAYLAVMYLFFKISFDFSAPFMDWTDGFISGYLGRLATHLLGLVGAPELVVGFVSEAVIGGVGFVVTFVPLIATMFFLLTLLGMSGYLARLPFLLDRFMNWLGLNGKAVIPLLLGLGCNVPAVMATRTMESRRDKLVLVMMIPFMSCPARLVVFSFFALLFFAQHAALVIFAMYALGVLVAVATSLLLKGTLFKRSVAPMIIELPPYRLPRLRTVGTIVWSHVREFLYRAGTLIFAVSVIVWALVHLPPGAKPQDSVVAQIGRAVVPVFQPLGLEDWRVTSSLIPAFLAREVALGFMGTIFAVEEGSNTETVETFDLVAETWEQVVGFGEAALDGVRAVLSLGIQTFATEDNETTRALREAVRDSFTPGSALAFMILLLLYNSCLGVYGVMEKEVGRRYALGFLGWSFLVGWVVAFVVYQSWRLISGGA